MTDITANPEYRAIIKDMTTGLEKALRLRAISFTPEDRIKVRSLKNSFDIRGFVDDSLYLGSDIKVVIFDYKANKMFHYPLSFFQEFAINSSLAESINKRVKDYISYYDNRDKNLRTIIKCRDSFNRFDYLLKGILIEPQYLLYGISETYPQSYRDKSGNITFGEPVYYAKTLYVYNYGRQTDSQRSQIFDLSIRDVENKTTLFELSSLNPKRLATIAQFLGSRITLQQEHKKKFHR